MEDKRSKEGNEIILNVYFLANGNILKKANAQVLGPLGLGLYHSGVEIDGVEYCFAGEEGSCASGVIQMAPLSHPDTTY